MNAVSFPFFDCNPYDVTGVAEIHQLAAKIRQQSGPETTAIPLTLEDTNGPPKHKRKFSADCGSEDDRHRKQGRLEDEA